MTINYDALQTYRKAIGAPWFVAPWDLNLFIARSGKVGLWDDKVLVACVDDSGKKIVLGCTATSDAWEGEWTNPSHPQGCVYVLDQHVAGGYGLGAHKNRPCLRQRMPFKCVRWPPDTGRVPTVEELDARTPFVGDQGTHIHNRVTDRAPAKPAPDDSEGCVVTLYQHEHAGLMRIVRQQHARHGSAIVSPTFCSLRDLQ